MTESDTFCLKWNEFENNVSSTLKDFKDEEDFFDVTLACEDEQVQAHKLIISACSPFFRQVLRKHKHSVPLLYLKGVRFKDMVALLTFMYHGEVNVAQEDISQFLATAEELQVKGLTHKDKSETNKPEPRRKSSSRESDNGIRVKSESEANVSEENVNANVLSKTESDEQRNSIAQGIPDFDDEIVEYPTTTENTFGVDQGNECPCNILVFDQTNILGQCWTDQQSPWNNGEGRADDKQYPCLICHKIFKSRGSLSSHKYSYHKEFSSSSSLPTLPLNPFLQTSPMQLIDFQQLDNSLEKERDIECPICHKFFSTRGSLATHKYNYHRNANNNPMT